MGIAPPLISSHPLYSQEGIILLLGIQHGPLVFASLQAGLRSMPVERIEAARSCGVGLLACTGIGIQRWLLQGCSFTASRTTDQRVVWRLGSARIWVEIGLWILMVLIFFIPSIALCATSLVPAYGVKLRLDTVTLNNYHEILFQQEATIRAFRNSLGLAGGAAAILMITMGRGKKAHGNLKR